MGDFEFGKLLTVKSGGPITITPDGMEALIPRGTVFEVVNYTNEKISFVSDAYDTDGNLIGSNNIELEPGYNNGYTYNGRNRLRYRKGVTNVTNYRTTVKIIPQNGGTVKVDNIEIPDGGSFPSALVKSHNAMPLAKPGYVFDTMTLTGGTINTTKYSGVMTINGNGQLVVYFKNPSDTSDGGTTPPVTPPVTPPANDNTTPPVTPSITPQQPISFGAQPQVITETPAPNYTPLIALLIVSALIIGGVGYAAYSLSRRE